MNQLNIKIPDGFRATNSGWGPALAEMLAGKTVYFAGKGAIEVAGKLKRQWIDQQGYRVRVSSDERGVAAWIERRKAK